MICPVELASEMSAFMARLAVEVPAGGRHAFLPGVRRGAGHEDSGSHFTSDGEEDHLEPSGRNHWHQRPTDAPLVPALPRVWLRRDLRPPSGTAESKAGAGPDGRADARAVPGPVLRSECAALLREAARGAPHRLELYLGQDGAARGRVGEEGASAGSSSSASSAAAAARDATALGREPAPLVSGRSLVRPAGGAR